MSDFWQNAKTLVFVFLPKNLTTSPLHPACGAALLRSSVRARGPGKIFWWVQTAPMVHRSRLDPPECFPRPARANGRSQQCRAARGVEGELCQIFGKTRKPGFPRSAKNPTKSTPRCTYGAHTLHTPPSPAREKRATKRDTCLRVDHPEARVAFCCAFLARGSKQHFRERGCACTAGEDFVGFLAKPRNHDFRVFPEIRQSPPHLLYMRTPSHESAVCFRAREK